MQDDVEKIVNAVLTAARNGDMMAAKIILDRIAPVRRSNSFDMPRIESRDDVGPARVAVLDAVADGVLTAGDAMDVFELIRRVARTLASSDGTGAR